jgi:Damage-control phosphatase ARMT1-like domain
MPTAEPPPILISPEGSFAWDVFHRRHPVLIESLIAALPYGPEQISAFRRLLDESCTGATAPLPDGAPDAAQWRAWDRGHFGKPWADAPFLWAESFFFRRILDATGYYAEDSAWAGVDPYAPMKAAELADPGLEAAFAWYGALPESGTESGSARRFAALVEAAVLGNRADLVFQVTEVVEGYTAVNPPLADDTERIRERLLHAERPATVAFVCDNAGRELIADLLLADELFAAGAAARVELHVKPAPYYLSDATARDVGACLARLRAMPGGLGAAGRRLFERAAAGDLRVLTHPFWCAPLSLHELPADLRAQLAGRSLLVKGDLNYRRLVGDLWWDPATPFADAVAHLGLPVAALRAAKSDVIVGVPRETVERLDAAEPDWRLNGRHSLIQAAL